MSKIIEEVKFQRIKSEDVHEGKKRKMDICVVLLEIQIGFALCYTCLCLNVARAKA